MPIGIDPAFLRLEFDRSSVTAGPEESGDAQGDQARRDDRCDDILSRPGWSPQGGLSVSNNSDASLRPRSGQRVGNGLGAPSGPRSGRPGAEQGGAGGRVRFSARLGVRRPPGRCRVGGLPVFAGTGQMDQGVAGCPADRPAEVDDQGVRESPGVLRLRRAIEDAPPGTGDALGERAEIRAELDLPASGRRQQRDRLDEQGQELHPGPEDQEHGPARVGQERLGQHPGPAGIAGQRLPGDGDGRRSVALRDDPPGGQESRLTVPAGPEETRAD